MYAFETGTNVWREYPAWPPKNAQKRNLYFHDKGKLAWNTPAIANAFDEYVSDPAKPVPFTSDIATGVPQEYMVGDQRFASTRTDVMVYQTEVLEEDHETLIVDLAEAGARYLLAKGGNGGWGNDRFKGPINRAPKSWTYG